MKPIARLWREAQTEFARRDLLAEIVLIPLFTAIFLNAIALAGLAVMP